MSKYTLRGSPAFDARVEKDLQIIIEAIKRLPDSSLLRGAVLLGGYGRGEGTPFRLEGEEVPFNDYDLVVVAESMSSSRRRQFQKELNLLETSLEHKVGVVVDLYLHTEDSLCRAEPSLMNYEMLYGHTMVWGESDLLRTMPRYDISHVSLEEGTRLLMNRGRLLLHVEAALGQGDKLLLEQRIECTKFLLKNYLAFGDCLLLLTGRYDIHYQVKADRIKEAVRNMGVPGGEWLQERYLSSIEFRNSGDPELLLQVNLPESLNRLRDYFTKFLLWYESRRLERSFTTITDYCSALGDNLGPIVQWPRNVAKTALMLGWRMLLPNPNWALLYPRTRLYPALCLLLKGQLSEQEEHLLLQLIGTKSREGCLTRFNKLALQLG